MSEEIFPYDQWVNEALLKVLARALKQLSEKGPSDSHHFFIDIQGSLTDPLVSEACQEIQAHNDLKILGSYPLLT